MVGTVLTKRRVLSWLSGTGAFGAVGWLLGRSDTGNESLSWAEQTRRGIQEHRTTNLTVTVTDDMGEPIPNATVDVAMQAHAFQFGTAVNVDRLLVDRSEPYRKRVVELFNTAVLENRHKWQPWETDPELADEATAWLRDQGLAVRGHAAIWQHLGHDVVPEDVIARLDRPDSDTYLAYRTTNHIRDIVGHYADELSDWDVVNEQLHEHAITDALAPDSPPERAPPVSDWVRTAAEEAPETALYLNDYDIVTGDEQQRAAYETLVRYVQESGAPLDGVGLQAHFGSQAEAIDPAEFRALLDRYASLDLSIKVTEYDTTGDNWTEEAEADHLETVLKTLYSHPAAEGFLMWGFWDGEHWRDTAPLFRADWSKKPAYDTYKRLVFEDWWTDVHGTTDADGQYRTQAFLGEYEITVIVDGELTTVTTSLTDPTTESIEVNKMSQ